MFLLFAPRALGFLGIAVCAWVFAVFAALVSAATSRLKLLGFVAAVLVFPAFSLPIVAVHPDRWLGPLCSGIGAALALLGGLLGIVPKKREGSHLPQQGERARPR